MADSFSFDGPQYVVGGGLVGVADDNGNTWQLQAAIGVTPETRDWVVDGTVVSPLANPLVGGVSTKSIRFDFDGTGAANARSGMDLAVPVTTGFVTLQYDYRNNTRLAGNNLFRLNVLNRAGVTTDGVTDDIQWQPYCQNGGGGAAAQNGFFGYADSAGAIGGSSIMDQSPYQVGQPFNPHDFKEGAGANDYWYRVKMYFDMDGDPSNPGRLLYIGLYDINCGSEILVGEHHLVRQTVAVRRNNTTPAPNAVRSFELRGTGSGTTDSVIDQSMWVDNLVIAAAPGFVLPPPAGAIPPVLPQTTFNADAGAQEVTTAFTLPTNAGETVSMARSGSTFYTSDSNNGLTAWSGGPSSSFADDMLEVDFDSDGTGVLVADTSGALHIVANLAGSPAWRDLLRYDTGTGTWVYDCDGDATGANTGNHSAALLTFGGTGHVMHAWTGASFYPSLNLDGSRGPTLAGVGNRWAGACTEAFADGATGSTMYYLQQTDASGLPISTNSQAYNAIYLFTPPTGGIGCDMRVTLATNPRISATNRLLPWVTNAPDGTNVNRHNMEFEPARNRIWVLRAGNSNQIGIYDFAQDRYGVLEVNRPGGAPLTMDKADLQLSADGSQMYIMARGEGAVYAVSTNIIFVDVGACIVGSNCTLMTMVKCGTAGGTYVGDNIACPPPGACCNGDTCTIAYQVTCTAGGGTFQGDNTVCNDYAVGAGSAFEDIFATGTDVPGIDDDNSVGIPIGFSFTHYGNTYTDVRVGANGYLSFSGGDGSESWVPNIGSSAEPNNLIAGLWTDLSPQCTTGGLKYEVRGTAPNRRLIVQWTNVSQYVFPCGTPVDQNTFQIVLFEGSNNAEVHFGLLNEGSITMLPPYQSGVENIDGSQSVVVDTALIVDNGSLALTQAPNPCLCPADFNHSGTVSVQDIFDFLAAYFSGNPAADVNNSGTVSVQDIFDYLALYFAGC